METANEQITAETCLWDEAFQRYLVDYGIMVQAPYSKWDIASKTSTNEGERVAERIIEQLELNSGYLVPYADIADHIYDAHGKDEIHLISVRASVLRREKLNRPDALFTASDLGLAVGVSELRVAAYGLFIIRRLWQEYQQEVHERDIALAVRGQASPRDIALIRRHISKLRNHDLAETSAVIEEYLQEDGTRTYRLTDIEDEEDLVDSGRYTPQYLEKPFQRWLARADVGLIRRLNPEDLDKETGIHSHQKKLQLLELLRHNRGYIIPYAVISNELYGTPYMIKQAKETFSSLKDRGDLKAEHVCVISNTGIGYGIAAVRVHVRELQVLHPLWQAWANNQGPVPADVIVQAVTGGKEDLSAARMATIISLIRSALAGSQFSLNKITDNGNISYELAEAA